jgi:hypothetical protein
MVVVHGNAQIVIAIYMRERLKSNTLFIILINLDYTA